MALLNTTIVSSFHKIHGKCNPNELYEIIANLKPDIIFEELSIKGFEIIYSPYYKPKSVEGITIKQYLNNYPIKHFPVDNYPINEEYLLSDAQIIWNHSSEYREIWDEKLKRISKEGYYFLNSTDCMEILDRLAKIEEEVLNEIKNLKLIQEYQTEKLLSDKREMEMIKSIYDIASRYPFDKSVFICGADHRIGIKHKIKHFEKKRGK
jgi:hypothetical protein